MSQTTEAGSVHQRLRALGLYGERAQAFSGDFGLIGSN